MKRATITATVLLISVLLAACASGLSQDEACKLATDYLLNTNEAGYQFHDPYRYPLVAYKQIEIMECLDFESNSERGWAKITVRAMGDEYQENENAPVGRVEFTPTFEFDRLDQGWKIVE